MNKQTKIYLSSRKASLEKFFNLVENRLEHLDKATGHFRKNYFERIQDYFYIQDRLVRG